MHNVAILHDVLLAFEPHFASVACASLAADEAALEVGMNDAGGRRRLAAPGDRPSPRFLRPRGEESNEVEERISRGDQAIEPGFFQTDSHQVIFPLVR